MRKALKMLLFFLILFFSFVIVESNQINKTKEIVKVIKDEKSEVITKSTKVEELRDKYKNDDIVGNILIEGIGIDEAILQSSDNDYYLVHDNYGNYDKYGSVFLDYRCNQNSKKLLIFGHSSTRISTPFNQLENYYDESFYKEHEDIVFIMGEEIRTYKIFSVYVEPNDFSYMNLNLSDEEYADDLKKYRAKSLYQTGVSIYPNDEILILQTCSNHPDYQKYSDKFLLIIAKKI